jgi:signal transduction histidine kinase
LQIELSALGFQAVITLLLAIVHLVLWLHGRARYHGAWACAWMLYAARLVLISIFIVTRHPVWLFAHQTVTGFTALFLLWAALLFSRDLRWRPAYLLFPVAMVLWAWYGVMVMGNMALAGASSAALMSGVSLWTGVVYWRTARERGSAGARLLAWTFWLWGLHHLDYPLLRSLGAAVLYGVFVDVLFIVVAALGALSMVAADSRRALAARTQQLEELTHLVLRAQEEERRRLARELHDEAGQALTAVKIELDLAGRADASALVGRVLDQIRNVSKMLRPSVLDDLGLEPALVALTQDFERRTGIRVDRELELTGVSVTEEVQVAVYRVVQEALTNVARHSGAQRAWVRATRSPDGVEVVVEDNGKGAIASPTPHMGLLGMRERVTELGGRFRIVTRPQEGFRIEATLPQGVRG